MSLLKQLAGTQVNEQSANIYSDVKRFKKAHASLEDHLEAIEALVKPSSFFGKNGASLGGDVTYLKDANTALDQLRNAIDEFHQSVGTASGHAWKA
jgi:ABC-type transporter Mla subunit MlaD